MLIDLLPTYSDEFVSCSLYTRKNGRKYVTLRSSDGTSTSTAYARYLMSVKLKRYLHDDDEEVDHIDNDFTNDSIDNLQILSGSENTKKYLNFHLRSLEHGTYAMYRTGKCRCSLCVEATRKLQRDSYLRNREKRNARRRFKRKNSTTVD